MPGYFSVTAEVAAGVPILTLTYGPEGMLQTTGPELSAALIAEYRKKRSDSSAESSSLIFVIDADTAGSPLIRALVDVYRAVAEKGKLFCVGYPRDFLPGLNALGVTSLPDFCIAPTVDSALQSLRAIP
jgi:hypothetical protein